MKEEEMGKQEEREWVGGGNLVHEKDILKEAALE